jgi:hypothetical protein
MIDNEKPWLNEPNSLRFTDKLTDLECYIKRHPGIGTLNGYVIIPKNNKLYGIHHDHLIFNNINIHGGLTFSGISKDIDEYIIGFDCAHCDDFAPIMDESIYHLIDCTYKDIEYVKAECRNLAAQLKVLLRII